MANILLIDNIDSFTYNLVDQLRKLKHKVLIYRNTISYKFILKCLNKIKNPILILSPGPGKPKNSGCMPKLIFNIKGKIPIIGICLGYQAIIESYGGKIINSKKIMHGYSSLIKHDNKNMFYNIKNPIQVARYHSLIGVNIKNKLVVNSKYKNIVMSVRNNKDKICGFQFHPESILTTYGSSILESSILWSLKFYKN
ncbi:Anthranilate synthase component 2 [Candidatus Annandia adelgestsuga]|uniref:Aminodeoxychorismate synthase component 2 n=1 Tax=Candidatus Annandia adelgestsuga TaxID=1302411 RepID=A0A3Q9CKZ6_9ENTR|nr:gamma-glutamyl-gamma-aminobutyrate hydrolase family protein [Candidatus Annandia adelgestsuga]AZP36412.1 Anthranilate synthase component 2 [Candidatus Annandia adelgestsuga]